MSYVKCIKYTSCLLRPGILRTGGDTVLQTAGGRRVFLGESTTTCIFLYLSHSR